VVEQGKISYNSQTGEQQGVIYTQKYNKKMFKNFMEHAAGLGYNHVVVLYKPE
jgi:hypothetical protein